MQENEGEGKRGQDVPYYLLVISITIFTTYPAVKLETGGGEGFADLTMRCFLQVIIQVVKPYEVQFTSLVGSNISSTAEKD